MLDAGGARGRALRTKLGKCADVAPSTARAMLSRSVMSARTKPIWPTWAKGWMKWALRGWRLAIRTRRSLRSRISQT